MMHHPNMHHQAMSGHPPQHLASHQGLPGHHQMPPHQMHRENRHVTLARVPLAPSGGGHGHGHGHGHAHALGGVGLHHAPAPAPPAPRSAHPARALHHAPHHHTAALPPQQMKPLRRPYGGVGGAYGTGGVLPPPYPPQPRHQPPPHHPHAGTKMNGDLYTVVSTPPGTVPSAAVDAAGDAATVQPAVAGKTGSGAGVVVGAGADADADVGGERAAPGDSEAARPAPATPANSKEKTPMCLVNELARYNKIKHQYRLTSETGPAHKKVFTVTLRLGDTEEYTAEGSSIKRAQHAAAHAALAGTRFPPPPPRATSHHHHHQPRHAVMPTVELNALAMKLCQPAVYTSVPAVAARGGYGGGGGGGGRGVRPPPYRFPLGVAGGPQLVYRVRVSVGGRAWLGEGGTPQAARHDAAARALHDLRPPSVAPVAAPTQLHNPAHATASVSSAPDAAAPHQDADIGEVGVGVVGDALSSEVKSPVSLVHELALKRNLSVLFAVKSERGPPHMRVFVTACTVGELETEGEGNGKKVSKRRAAERMLDEMRRRWPPALLRPRPPHDRRRHQPAKKKPRNLIKEGGTGAGGCGGGAAGGGGGGCGGGGGGGCGGGDNPISVLAVARHALRARSPQYRVVEERGGARRREFLVQCDAPPHCATGLGPNKKTAKRRAAHNVLLAMESSANSSEQHAAPAPAPATAPAPNPAPTETDVLKPPAAAVADGKRKEGGGEGGGGEARQPVPGVLLMDYAQRPHHATPTAAPGAGGGSEPGVGGGGSPGAKDQLLYLAQLLGFTVQFSDFPKRNHGEYLSLVSLSTEPPVMCHGGGASTQHSHEQCARAALRALALMGLDAPPPPPPPDHTLVKVSSGVAE